MTTPFSRAPRVYSVTTTFSCALRVYSMTTTFSRASRLFNDTHLQPCFARLFNDNHLQPRTARLFNVNVPAINDTCWMINANFFLYRLQTRTRADVSLRVRVSSQIL